MSAIKWLNNLLFMENLLGVHRNYCNQKKIKKYFIIFRVFVQTVLQTIMIIRELYLLLGRDNYNQINLIYSDIALSAYINCLSSIVTGISCSGAFMSYSKSISRVAEYFRDDKKLINSLKKLHWFSMIYILLFITGIVFRSAQISIKLLTRDPLTLILLLVSQTILKTTIILQHLMFFVVIMILISLSKSLTSLISAVQKRIQSCDTNSDEHCDITRQQIQGWVELYRDLSNCCEKVTLCFGRQFLFSLIITISHFILMAYQIVYANALNIADTEEYKNILFIIFSYISVMLLPLVAGQIADKQGVKLHRVLVRLYCTMIADSGEAETKLIKDFIRLIKKNSLQIKLLCKIPVGLYMLPIILTLAVNNVIVMLQFNHII